MANIYHAGNQIGDAIPGHAIKNGSDVTMTQRNNLQFVGASITDDNANDKTIVTLSAGGGSTVNVTTSEASLEGATVTLTDGTTTLTSQISSGEASFVGVTLIGTLTLTASDGNDTARREFSAPYFGIYNETLSFWAAPITITTTSANLYNQTITVYKGGVAVGTTAFNGAGSATYTASETGTYTFSVTISAGTFTSDPVVVTEETTYTTTISAIPDGSTVTPTDDIQTWLNCAGIFDKSYTTVAEVLADSTTLLALMSDSNAADYLVRSTTWASDITADSTAMTDIGANDYTAMLLIEDETWRAAILASDYMGNVFDYRIPTQTSASTQATASGYNSTFYPWQAFDGNDSTSWFWSDVSLDTVKAGYLEFDFNEEIYVAKITLVGRTPTSKSGTIVTYFQIYNPDTETWENFGSNMSFPSPASANSSFAETGFVKATKLRLRVSSTINSSAGTPNYVNPTTYEIQVYGREIL